MNLRARLKTVLLGTETKARTVRFGPGRGIQLMANPGRDMQRLLGLAEAEVSALFCRMAAHCHTYCDVGASNGWYAFLVGHINHAARIVACEPQVDLTAAFKSNLALNPFLQPDRVRWVPAFIGTHQTPLDAVLVDAQEPIFIKIDAEGGELDILRSGSLTLNREQVCLIVETHSAELERACIELLQRASYSVLVIKPAWWRILVPERRPLPHNRWLAATRETWLLQ